MTNPYSPPNLEHISLHAPIRLKGFWASTGHSRALPTTSCKVNPLNPTLDFCYEPNLTKYVAAACYIVLITMMPAPEVLVFGWLIFTIFYAVLVVIMTRRVQFNLREQDLLVDRKRSVVSIRKMRNGRCFEMAFKVRPVDIDQLLGMASSVRNSTFKKKRNWPLCLLIVCLSIAAKIFTSGDMT